MRTLRKIFYGLLSLLLSGCMGHPKSITPVKSFEMERYLGKWYEIARLDHSFERGLDHVTADYTLRDDGGITVTNRGYSPENKSWREATGKGYFVKDKDEGHLKVSFFGPFYSSYVIFELDNKHCQYAFVSGYNTSYLWLLARTPDVEKEIISKFIKRAENAGFDTEELIFVSHDDIH